MECPIPCTKTCARAYKPGAYFEINLARPVNGKSS